MIVILPNNYPVIKSGTLKDDRDYTEYPEKKQKVRSAGFDVIRDK